MGTSPKGAIDEALFGIAEAMPDMNLDAPQAVKPLRHRSPEIPKEWPDPHGILFASKVTFQIPPCTISVLLL
jgi:hypothetical protein